jgi:hypothetical protein
MSHLTQRQYDFFAFCIIKASCFSQHVTSINSLFTYTYIFAILYTFGEKLNLFPVKDYNITTLYTVVSDLDVPLGTTKEMEHDVTSGCLDVWNFLTSNSIRQL